MIEHDWVHVGGAVQICVGAACVCLMAVVLVGCSRALKLQMLRVLFWFYIWFACADFGSLSPENKSGSMPE